uniref:Thiamine-triphosphatase n=2 Tax=Lates calcarifer TaxID=8187 RepID=A0A4W6C677_LATCA
GESTMSVEVERKFLCSEDTVRTLEEIGAVCVGQRQIQDRYFDTPRFDLTLRDMWLRNRGGCWELKCPTVASGSEEAGSKKSEMAALCTHYREITSLPEIQLKVTEVLGLSETRSWHQDQSWLSNMNLVCFAEFKTERRSFTLEEGGVQVDLDQTDFGYHVGEIEVVVAEGGDIQAALEKIQRTAQRLGLTADQKVEGKMHVYLQRNHPEHYARLLSEHIL